MEKDLDVAIRLVKNAFDELSELMDAINTLLTAGKDFEKMGYKDRETYFVRFVDLAIKNLRKVKQVEDKDIDAAIEILERAKKAAPEMRPA